MYQNIEDGFYRNGMVVIFLSPILGWLSVVIIGIFALFQLRLLGDVRQALAAPHIRRAFIAASVFVLLMSVVNTVFGGSGIAAAKLLAGAVLPFALVSWFKDNRLSIEQVARYAALAVITISVLMGVEWLLRGGVRVQGLSGNPLFVSLMMSPFILFSITRFVQERLRQKTVTMVAWCLGMLCLAVFLQARASFLIVLMLSFVVILCQLKGLRSHVYFVAAILVFALFALWLLPHVGSVDFVARLKQLSDFGFTLSTAHVQDVSMSLRLVNWQAALLGIHAQPFVGYGITHEHAILQRYIAQGQTTISSAHQQYFSFMLWAGVLGLVAGLAYLFFPLLAAYKSNKGHVVLLLILVVCFVLNGLTDTFFDDLRILFYYTTVGLMLVSIEPPTIKVAGTSNATL